jgi:gluconolactonase
LLNPFGPIARLSLATWSRLPDRFREPTRSEWADANKGGEPIHSFLEGPGFDSDGQLWVTDIPHGRIFRVSSAGEWELVLRYDGWPNGLRHLADGTVMVACRRHGLMRLDRAGPRLEPVARGYRSEGFKGLNDLIETPAGDILMTDQGQTGWQDPTGRVYRLTRAGQIEIVAEGLPSPNGLALDGHGRNLLVAVTRANAIWRVPLAAAGPASKVGTWIQLSGGGGPDGILPDGAGGLLVCHLGSGLWRFDANGFATHLAGRPGVWGTNLALAGGQAFVTDSGEGAILRVELGAATSPG